MLIRFVVSNFMSIGDELEFNLLPEQYRKTFPHHVYEDRNIRLLKASAIYGANGAGKSNLLAALSYLQRFVLGKQDIPKSTSLLTYRLSDDKVSEPIRMEVEFIHDGFSLAYGIEFQNGIVLNEYLYELGFKSDDVLIFERKYEDGKNVLKVDNKKVFKTKNDKMFLSVVEEHFLENHFSPNRPMHWYYRYKDRIHGNDNRFLQPKFPLVDRSNRFHYDTLFDC